MPNAASPFVYHSEAREVRSTDPSVKILATNYMGGGESFRTYSVVIARGPYTYCFHAGHDYLRDGSNEYLLTADGRPVGYEVMQVQTRWTLRDAQSGEQFASTFPEDERSYREAVDLAIGFYAAARLRRDAPLKRIRFARSERVEPKVIEIAE